MSSDGSTSNSVISAGDLEKKLNSVDLDKDVILTWRSLRVGVEKKLPKKSFWNSQKTETQVILDNVSGYCKSGVLTAIMGSSGAGKTTLLATVSQRNKLQTTGDILVNGKPVSREIITKMSGFVPQHDLVYSTLTVTEHMEFMANLMMDQRVRKIHRNRRIYCLLSELGLLRCCRTRLGNLSGGEMKRLSLAVQLLTDPPLLFCDEPTTGLDSFSAGVVLENLRQCAERGKAVVCTIHQPASGHFELFHQVLLLAGGRVAYLGPVSDASGYFNSVGLVCPPAYNAAEFYVQQLAVLPGKEKESHSKNHWLCDQFAKSEWGQELQQTVTNEYLRGRAYEQPRGVVKGNWSSHSSTSTSGSLDGAESEEQRQFKPYLAIVKPTKLTQLYWLTWRSFKDITRNCADILLRFFLLMLIAVLISTPYTGMSEELSQRTIQNMQGFMYLIITEVVFTFSYSVFHTFPGEIPILLREINNGLYQPGPYYISKIMIVVPKSIIEATLYAMFIFWLAELRGGFVDLMEFALPIVCASLAATAYGTLMSAAFESVATASLVSVPIELLGVMFSGMYLHLQTLPAYLSWIKYLSQFYYGQEAISITQWQKINSIDCPADDSLPCIADGDEVLYQYGYNRDNYGTDLFGLGSIYVGAHILGFACLWKRSRQQAIY